MQKFDVQIFICSILGQKNPFLVAKLFFYLLAFEIKYVLGTM